MRAAAGDDALEALPAGRGRDLAADHLGVDAGGVEALGCDDGRDLDAGGGERAHVLERLGLLGPDDGAVAGLHAVHAGEAGGAAGQHHAGQVVLREDAVDLAAAAGDHDRLRVDVVRSRRRRARSAAGPRTGPMAGVFHDVVIAALASTSRAQARRCASSSARAPRARRARSRR